MPNTVYGDSSNFKQILFRNISLPLGFGLFSIAVFVGLIVYLIGLLNWVEHTELVISNASEITRLQSQQESTMRGYLISRDEAYRESFQAVDPEVAVELSNLRKLVSDNHQQEERLDRIAGLQQRWSAFAKQNLEGKSEGAPSKVPVNPSVGKQLFDEMRRQIVTFIETEQRLRQDRIDSARRTTVLAVAIYVVFSLILSALLAFLGRRELLTLSRSYNSALKIHTEYSTKLEEKAWLEANQAELVEKLAGERSLGELGSIVLKFLAERLKIQVATFYACNPGEALHRYASYGFDRSNETSNQRLEPGEGLVGQAVASNEMLVLENLSASYLKVTSSLGGQSPKTVAVLPVTNDKQVIGAIEVGGTGQIAPSGLALLNQLSISIGNALAAANYRQRLHTVVSETRQLNDELQVQQEELRCANEELEEQSQALEHSQTELEQQQAELQATNERLSEQATILDESNEKLRDLQLTVERRSDALEKASKYKSEFLANMSHELRTPLNSALILAKLLSDNSPGNLNTEQVNFASTIYSAGNDLLNLINDILDISKVEAGKLELSPTVVPIAHVAETMRTTFGPAAAQKGISLIITVETDTPAVIVTDRQRLEQVLKNLLSNAMKFTERGKVEMTIARASADRIVFAVSDTGIGIDPSHHEKIFEAFSQADGSTSRRFGGSGLGLSISRELTVLLGGTLGLSSAPGRGSTFTLIMPETWQHTAPIEDPLPVTQALPEALPAKIPNAPSPLPASKGKVLLDDRANESRGERTVLVVEDDVDFAAILYKLAKEMSFHCLVAQSGAEALALAAQFVPDAVLLDMRLPDRPGLEVLEQLKATAATRHIPVHVISAADRTEAAFQLGAIGYAVKPTSREELQGVLQKFESKWAQSIKRILLVEDDARQRDSIVRLIDDADVEIVAVGLGEEALKHLADTVFDCMIIDLKLPDIAGLELLKRMAATDVTSFPPVIVYTGRNLTRDEEAELMQYSRSIIIKGARSPERLLDEVTLFLHKVESTMTQTARGMLKTVRNRDRTFEGRTVLLVDDDVRNIFALTSALEHKGIQIVTARNGVEAIDKLDSGAEIDLVFMDVMMPVMDGLEATRRIRQDARFKKLPIISVTAKAMQDDQEQCRLAGATDYLAKPVDLGRLYSLLRVWMPPLERSRP